MTRRSRNLTLLLAILVAASATVAAADRDDVLIADFESATWGEWKATGDAFDGGPAAGALANQMQVSGYEGERLVNSFRGGDESTGELLSSEFEVTRRYLVFLVGGGRHPGRTGVELLVDDEVVREATGADSEELDWASWRLEELTGKRARIRIVDRASGGWGHINVDQILLSDRPRARRAGINVEVYRASEGYYREPWRPQFHFTPEVNWMNDPNGLVYHDGEYHLFYQYNPQGNSWGHMSWGHAVSEDLVHWKHLPIALYEADGVMMFSGSAVVDHRNTSGFGSGGAAPLVAIYTGHRSDRQTQDIAYSLDRGRSWTKYPGNPVLDIDEKDFRDPKVFWHEATSKWVMVVSLAAAKRLQFYGSSNLREWSLLSEFGPAGAKEKANWECPDLFELEIENEPGKKRWVLEVDMGGGAPAGGSGGEYFVGNFDGTKFTSDRPLGEVAWVDYGRDFYAPVSWSDIPPRDGRRIWIGWMNNWETCLLPTSPWRSAQSIPRSLTLRRVDGRLHLIQRPVRELEKLRARHWRLGAMGIEGGPSVLADAGLRGTQLEIALEIELGSARECGLSLRRGDGEETVIAFDAGRGELSVDRTRSGEVEFDERFAGRHIAPLTARDGRIELHVFVDRSSVEVFADGGRIVLTERIFPKPESDGLMLWARGGKARVLRVDAWELRSIWPRVSVDVAEPEPVESRR